MVCVVLAAVQSIAADHTALSPTISGTVSAGDGVPYRYSPFLGMDRNGRIPKVSLPADVPNPERWRYLPEGRIKPGTVLDRLMVTSFFAPYVFYDSDIGFGAGISLTDIDFRQQRRREFGGIFLSYTTEGQQRYSIIWQRWLYHRDLANGGVIIEERSFTRAWVEYEKTLTRRFFGIGPDTLRTDETSYTDELSRAQFMVQQSLPDAGDNVVYQARFKAEHHDLGPGKVSGWPTTDTGYPLLFAEGDDYSIVWLGASLRYDTRDSQHAPYQGWMVEAGADAAPVQSRGNHAVLYTVQGSLVQKVPGLFHRGGDAFEEHRPTDVLAFGAQAQWTQGDLPFWALPSLGGSKTLRGYIANRFTDNALWHASAEYRFWTLPRGFGLTDTIRIERIGAALFYDVGTVADGLRSLTSAQTHNSYGISLRFSLERAALFRGDVGFSREGVNVSFGYGLSF